MPLEGAADELGDSRVPIVITTNIATKTRYRKRFIGTSWNVGLGMCGDGGTICLPRSEVNILRATLKRKDSRLR